MRVAEYSASVQCYTTETTRVAIVALMDSSYLGKLWTGSVGYWHDDGVNTPRIKSFLELSNESVLLRGVEPVNNSAASQSTPWE